MPEFAVRTIATGVGFAEGPVIRPDGEIVFVSISQGRVYANRQGRTTVLAEVGGGPNGATEWSDGSIYVAQNGGKWGGGKPYGSAVTGGVQIVARDGTVSWLTKDPITPNDLCFGPDDRLYVTDPSRFAMANKDGRIFSCDRITGEAELLRTFSWYTNGIAFGVDDALYVADSSGERIVRFSLDGGRLGKEETFAMMPSGVPDGFLFDERGNLIVGAISETAEPGKIYTFDRSGKLQGEFRPGEGTKYTNVALGAGRTLIVTDSEGGNVLAVDGWPHAGLPLYPFRPRDPRD